MLGASQGWQTPIVEKVAPVQSMQLDSAAVLPLLLANDLSAEQAPQSTPFSEQQQKDCRMDGALEGDARQIGFHRERLHFARVAEIDRRDLTDEHRRHGSCVEAAIAQDASRS